MRFCRSLLVSFILCFLIVALGSSFAWCTDNASSDPITIEADRMESLQKENAVSFAGHVEARQGDFFLNADNMTIYYFSTGTKKDDPKGLSKNVKKLYAHGNVTLSKKELTASGDQVDYLAGERKVIITGNSKVLRDNNIITGEKIVLYLDEGKSIVESVPGNGNRVKAIINPGSKNN
jgi:lipopolysaccharide export system protein LptA